MRIQNVIVATPNRQLRTELEGRDPRLLVEFEGQREGKTAALNRVLRYASGDILVLASADIKISRNTIPKLVGALVENPEWGAVDSRVELVNGDQLLMDKISTLLWDVHNSTLDDLDSSDRLGHVAGDLLAVRRELVDEFPEVINDDAYLAFKVRGKGFLVKRVRDAIVWIAGPRTPTDYIIQRSRVLQGHLEMIRLFGKMPSTFEFKILTRPRYIQLFVKTLARLGTSSISTAVVAGFLELLCFQLAIIATLSRRSSRVWRIAHTTKEI